MTVFTWRNFTVKHSRVPKYTARSLLGNSVLGRAIAPIHSNGTEPFSWRGGAASRLLWFAVGAAVLAALVPLLLLMQVEDVGRSSAWVLTLAVMIWSGLRLAAVISAGRPLLFDFFFHMFTYVFMGLAPTVQIRSGLLSTTTQGISGDFDVPTAWLVVIGVASYEAGRLVHILREQSGVGWRPRRLRKPPRPVLDARVNTARSLILVALGVLFSGYFVSKVGIGSLFGSRDSAFAIRSAIWPDPSTRAIVYSLAIYPLLVGIGAIAQVRRGFNHALSSWYSIVIIAAMAVLLVVVNPVSSARYSLGTVLFALVVYAGAMVNATRARVTLVATLAGLIFLFPLADAFRGPAVKLVRNGFFGEYQANPDYDAFWQIANSLSYVTDGLVQPFRQLLGSVFFWLPRLVWPDKPLDTGSLLAQYRGYTFGNLSAPLWAEFLVNGGVIFLLIGFLITGFFLRTMDKKLLPAFTGAGLWAIVGAVFPVYMTILLRGSLLQATGAVAIATACVLFVRRAPAPPHSHDQIRPNNSTSPLTEPMSAADGLHSSEVRPSDRPAPARRQSPAFRTDRQ